jgi:hypothetical protein
MTHEEPVELNATKQNYPRAPKHYTTNASDRHGNDGYRYWYKTKMFTKIAYILVEFKAVESKKSFDINPFLPEVYVLQISC